MATGDVQEQSSVLQQQVFTGPGFATEEVEEVTDPLFEAGIVRQIQSLGFEAGKGCVAVER